MQFYVNSQINFEIKIDCCSDSYICMCEQASERVSDGGLPLALDIETTVDSPRWPKAVFYVSC